MNLTLFNLNSVKKITIVNIEVREVLIQFLENTNYFKSATDIQHRTEEK